MTSEPPPGGRQASGSWGWAAPDRPQAPQGRLLRGLWGAIAGLSILLIGIVGFAWQHRGQGLNPVAEAAEKTQAEPGSRADIEAHVSAGSESFTMSGRAVFNAQTGLSRVVLEVPAPEPIGAVKLIAVGDERTVYLRSKLFASALPPGRRWMGIDPWLGNDPEGMLPAAGDAEGQLELLANGSGEVRELGEDEVRGVSTTRYEAVVDFRKYAAVLRREGRRAPARYFGKLTKLTPPTQTDVWIDGDGLVRRMTIEMPVLDESGKPGPTIDMQIEFFDFGIAPTIRLPESSDVFDTTPLVRAELDLLNGETLGKLNDPQGSPLSAPAFRKRASAICRDVERKIDRTVSRAKPQQRALEKVGEGASKEELLRTVRAYLYKGLEPLIPVIDEALRRLGRLNPPARLSARYGRLLRIGAIESELIKASAGATELGDFPLARRLDRRLNRLSNRSDKLAEQIGLEPCADEKG